MSQRHRQALSVRPLRLPPEKGEPGTALDAVTHTDGVAARLRHGVRPGDVVARLGGNEFVVLLPQVAARDQLDDVAQRLAQRVSRPVTVKGEAVHVGVSVGVALGEHTTTATALLAEADAAMYAAKRPSTAGVPHQSPRAADADHHRTDPDTDRNDAVIKT